MSSFSWIEHLLEAVPIPLHREERVPVCLPIVVTGYGENAFFQAHTFTIDFSPCGCCLYLTRKPVLGNLFFISLAGGDGTEISPESRALYQVTWVHPDGSGWVVGAKKLA